MGAGHRESALICTSLRVHQKTAGRFHVKQRKGEIPDFLGDLDELWTVDDMASYLRKPVSWVYDNHKRYFHAARAGQQLLFAPAEIKAWIRGQMWPK